MSLDRARRLGHRIESLATASLVARETMPQHEPERSPGEILLAEFDAVITGEGLSRNAGERVLAAVDSAPETFASASVHQLRAYVGAAVGAGDPAGVGRLIEAAPEASREALSVRARDAFWFQLDLDTWAREGIFSEYPRSVLRSLRRQPYWRRGTVLADSGLDDRLRLAQAIQLRLKQPSPQAPPELGTVFVQLRDAARPAEMSRFDALRTVQSKHPGPSRLPGYQRGLITWARLEIDPTLDPEDPRSYERARRLGWYHDRPQVLRFLAQGARLNAEETTRVIEQINALSESQRLRFVGWFLGSQPEADKLAWIRSQARADGEASTLGQRVDEADETESFLAVFKVSAPAELGKIDDLPSLLLVLDQWDLTAHGYIDAMCALRYQQLLRERRLAEQNQPNTQHGFHRSLILWRNGGPDHVVQFIAQVRRARDRARSAWSTLVGLQRLDNADSAEPTAITSAVESARGVLGESRSLLAKLADDADGFVDGIFERGKEAEALRSQATETAAETSWLVGGLRGAFSAVGGFVDKLGEQLGDPKAWKTALEVGLEVAGATFSGGASVLIKLVKWLATTGVALKDTITGAAAKVRALAEPGGLAKMVPIGGLFSKSALISNVVGALFGEVPPEPQMGSPSATPKDGETRTPKGKRTPSQRLIDRIGSLVDTVRSAAAGVVGPAWAALRSMDLTRFDFFRLFARTYYRLMRFREKLAGAGTAAARFVVGLREQLDGFFNGLKTRLGTAAALFGEPAKAAGRWVREVTSSSIEYLIGLLITNPPSAILRTTFKAAASLLATDTTDLAAMLKQKLAGVPLIGDMIAKIESTVEGAVAPVLTEPATKAYETGSALLGQAKPRVETLQNRFGTLLDHTEGFIGALTGGLWDQIEESKVEASTSEATLSPENGELTQRKRIQRTASVGLRRQRPDRRGGGVQRGSIEISRQGAMPDLQKPPGACSENRSRRNSETNHALVQRAPLSSDDLDPELEHRIVVAEVLKSKSQSHLLIEGKSQEVQELVRNGQNSGQVRTYDPGQLRLVNKIMGKIQSTFSVQLERPRTHVLAPGAFAALGQHQPEAKTACAFVYENEIYLEGKAGKRGVEPPEATDDTQKILAHELIHMASHRDFDELFKASPVEEGVVEFFARQLYPYVKTAYDREVDVVETLKKGLQGKEGLIQGAFFRGQIDAIDKALEDSFGISFRELGSGLKHVLRLEGSKQSWRQIKNALGKKENAQLIRDFLSLAGHASILDYLRRGGKELRHRRRLEDILNRLGEPIDGEDLDKVEKVVHLKFELERAKDRPTLGSGAGEPPATEAPHQAGPGENTIDETNLHRVSAWCLPDARFDKLVLLLGGTAGAADPLVYQSERIDTVLGYQFGPKPYALVAKRFFGKADAVARKIQTQIRKINKESADLRKSIDE